MKNITTLISIILVSFPTLVNSQSIVTTKHNLSVSGLGAIKATTENEICIFCHTPHNSTPKAPLWNRNVNGGTYTLYNSSTLNALPGQPDGSSILCLSCHDGTIALGDVVSRATPITMSSLKITGKSNLTTDLSNDHPISFAYNAALAASDGQLKTPPLSVVSLDKNSKMQCTSCHDPHKETNPKFLVASTQFSALCLQCHNKTYWGSSTHKTSTKTWNNAGTSPWAHVTAPYANVTQNACANCHDPHNANGKARLLKYLPEENNCLDCHNGNVATSTKNIQAQFAKTYKHNVAGYTGTHDPIEANAVTTKHVECADCHNPHASNATTAVAPFVNGTSIGVKGINQAGNAVAVATNAYEICYKCHAGNSWAPAPALPRQIVQNNVRLEFATTNPSYHPVVGARNDAEITPNLVSPNTASTIMYCTACHASNNSADPKGPHGSTNQYLLKLNYSTAYTGTTGITESATAYALCYSCHNRTNIIGGSNTFREHNKHIVGERAPCSICHDPHGVSSTQGSLSRNGRLINFRTDKVTPDSGGRLYWQDDGARRGRCYLTCHGKNHSPLTY
ncbi:MAG: cytochrome c3 family protein [Lutibacter sp.]|nr:cytochrome c3 family protein [Lutibacter sp.]